MDEEYDPYADQGDLPHEQVIEPEEGPHRGPGLGDDLRQLMEDGRTFVAAEIAWQKARASFAGKQAGGIALLGLSALALAFCALMALTFGLVLSLAPLLTAWGATAAVTGALLLAAMLAGAMAAMRAKRMTRLIAQRKPEP